MLNVYLSAYPLSEPNLVVSTNAALPSDTPEPPVVQIKDTLESNVTIHEVGGCGGSGQWSWLGKRRRKKRGGGGGSSAPVVGSASPQGFEVFSSHILDFHG